MVQAKEILMAGALLALAGCTSDFGPWPMPTGYTYHTEQHKAPPGPEPVFKKWEVERKEKAQAAEAPVSMDTHFDDSVIVADAPVTAPLPAVNDPQLWLDAANDLTGRLFGTFGNPTEAVYLPPGTDEEGQFFAAALHAALQGRGFTVAGQPGTGPFTLRYAMNGMGGGNDGRKLLTITMQSGMQNLAEESGIYTVGGGMSAATVRGDNAPVSLTAPGGSGF